jgi:hypothetical protein
MEPNVRELIKAIVKARNLNMKEISLNVLGKNPAYLQQYIERGVPRRLPEDVRPLLAKVLGVSETQLKEAVKSDSGHTGLHSAPDAHSAIGELKVLGMAECGPDGWSLFNGETVIEYVPRPANLRGVPDAYAVYISGTSHGT